MTLPDKTKWSIDPAHSEIAFKVKHLMIANVKGVFKEFDANIYIPGDDFASAEIEFWMNPATVYTGDPKRDQHLKSVDFFNVENHRKITFISTNIKNIAKNDTFGMKGDLTIKGITKPVKLDVKYGGIVKDPWGGERAGFSINGIINRKNWELNWNVVMEAGGVMVSEEVNIVCEVELIKSV